MMFVVIQCAATKHPHAGHLQTDDGRKLLLVAQPAAAPPSSDLVYARPDDLAGAAVSWRTRLMHYNEDAKDNPLGLLPAISLYVHPTYKELAEKIGVERLFILSAGWGLLPGSYLTPNYDITFTPMAELYKRRRRSDIYQDFAMLPKRDDSPMLFFGGKDYAPFFASVTREYRGPRTIFYNSSQPPMAPGCQLERFATTTRTNWHYECAREWLSEYRKY